MNTDLKARAEALLAALKVDGDLLDEDERVTVAFIALHGTFGEDGCVQGAGDLTTLPDQLIAALAAVDQAADSVVSLTLPTGTRITPPHRDSEQALLSLVLALSANETDASDYTSGPSAKSIEDPQGCVDIARLGGYLDALDGVPQPGGDLAADGHALCVAGNHDVKLARKLRGRDVKLTHGLAESVAQLATQPASFSTEVADFLEGLIAHYVLDGGQVVVAHAGLQERLSPTAPVDGSAYEHTSEQAHDLPRSFLQALERLEHSADARRLLGDAFVEGYVAVKALEYDSFQREISAWERRWLVPQA